MAFLTFVEAKAAIVAIAEAKLTEDSALFATLASTLGDSGVSAPFNTVAVGPTGHQTTLLRGSGFAVAEDRAHPENGPAGATEDYTVFAVLIRGLIDHVNAKYETEVQTKVNALIDDYNSRFGTTFDNL